VLVLQESLVRHTNFQTLARNECSDATTCGPSSVELASGDKRREIGDVIELPGLTRNSDASEHTAFAGTGGTGANAGDQRGIRQMGAIRSL
jgi:hypothetical protein